MNRDWHKTFIIPGCPAVSGQTSAVNSRYQLQKEHDATGVVSSIYSLS